MYPVKLGFNEAIRRIEGLLKNGHHAEALVTAVFTLEKTMRRSLKLSILARGFSMSQAEKLTERKGFGELKDMWSLFDKTHHGLPEFIGNKGWNSIPKAIEMRNKLVHGSKVYNLDECKEMASHVLSALVVLRSKVTTEYGSDPWQRITGRRKSQLPWLA